MIDISKDYKRCPGCKHVLKFEEYDTRERGFALKDQVIAYVYRCFGCGKMWFDKQDGKEYID